MESLKADPIKYYWISSIIATSMQSLKFYILNEVQTFLKFFSFQYLPDCHSFLGHVFLRVSWTPWVYSNINQWDYATRNRILSTLLLMFVKLSYEPNVRENLHLLTLLQEAISFPWYMLDYQGIEGIFEWFVMSTEPSSILCLNSEHSAVDNSILK